MPISAHPVAMFEIMANDQESLIAFYKKLFGWEVNLKGGFAYINFPIATTQTLGGIGKAQPGVPGWEKGTAFYISVDCITTTLALVTELGGSTVLERTKIDGYTFGMFHDTEQNLIGLLEPF